MGYDLEERTEKFGEAVIDLVKTLRKNDYNSPLINQITKSSTSIGANYMEANGASSKRDFRNKISICLKETRETKHWLRMIARANPDKDTICRKLWKEAHELTLIFGTIFNNSKEKV